MPHFCAVVIYLCGHCHVVHAAVGSKLGLFPASSVTEIIQGTRRTSATHTAALESAITTRA